MYHRVSPEDKLMEAFKGSQLSSRTFGRDKNTITLSFPLHNNTSQLRYITSRYITLHYITLYCITSHQTTFYSAGIKTPSPFPSLYITLNYNTPSFCPFHDIISPSIVLGRDNNIVILSTT